MTSAQASAAVHHGGAGVVARAMAAYPDALRCADAEAEIWAPDAQEVEAERTEPTDPPDRAGH
jgi:hypothetical protein